MKFKDILYDLYMMFTNNLAGSEKLLSENALMSKYHCSRSVIRRVLNEFKNQEMLIVNKGKGYYIASPFYVFDKDYAGSFKKQLRDKRVVIYSTLLESDNLTIEYFKLGKDQIIRCFEIDYYANTFLICKELIYLNPSIKTPLNELDKLINLSNIISINGVTRNGIFGIMIIILDLNKYRDLVALRKVFCVNNMINYKL